jgi:hypothetical protein
MAHRSALLRLAGVRPPREAENYAALTSLPCRPEEQSWRRRRLAGSESVRSFGSHLPSGCFVEPVDRGFPGYSLLPTSQPCRQGPGQRTTGSRESREELPSHTSLDLGVHCSPSELLTSEGNSSRRAICNSNAPIVCKRLSYRGLMVWQNATPRHERGGQTVNKT